MVSLLMCVSTLQVVHAQSTYRFLAFGNSLTQHPPTSFWWNTCGMAASKPENDWVHRVTQRLKMQYGNIETDVIHNGINSDIPTQEIRNQVEERVKKLSETPYSLITIQEGDNVEMQSHLDTYEEKLTWLITMLKKYNPQAQIVIIGNFHVDTRIKTACENLQKEVATRYGCSYADLSHLKENKAYCSAVGDIVYDAQGSPHHVDSWTVARHPNDKGMEYIAYKVLEQLGITLYVGHDFDDLNQKSTKSQEVAILDPKLNGFQKKGKKTYYYFHGLKAQGLTKIHNSYYLFNQDGVLQQGKVKMGNVTYFLDAKGRLLLKKVKKSYFNKNNLPISKGDGCREEAYLAACKKSKKWKKKRLLHAEQWVRKVKKGSSLKASKQDQAAQNALQILQSYRGNTHGQASAFAYLAQALGYKSISIISFAKSDQVKIKDKTYQFGKIDKKEKGKKMILSLPKLKAVKVHYSQPKGKIVKYDRDMGSLLYANGQTVTGLVVYKNKFYQYDTTGVLDQERSYKINQAATIQNKINDLEKIVGKPISKQYFASCFGDGEDGLWAYKNFIVSTFKGNDGVEIYIAVKSTMQS